MYKNKLLVVLMVLFSMVIFTLTACSAPAPSDEDMKGVIQNITDQQIQKKYTGLKLDSIQYNEFKVLNAFSKMVNGDKCYYAKIHIIADVVIVNPFNNEKIKSGPIPLDKINDTEQYSFIKQGNEWYGRLDW